MQCISKCRLTRWDSEPAQVGTAVTMTYLTEAFCCCCLLAIMLLVFSFRCKQQQLKQVRHRRNAQFQLCFVPQTYAMSHVHIGFLLKVTIFGFPHPTAVVPQRKLRAAENRRSTMHQILRTVTTPQGSVRFCRFALPLLGYA